MGPGVRRDDESRDVVLQGKRSRNPCAGVHFGTCFCHMPWRLRISNQRRVRLFRNGRNQAVRIPVEFELPGNEAIMHRDGDRLVIEPVRKRGLIAMLKSMTPLDEEF
jgi:antitoxin VapB